jgi:hypothetical protein
MIRYNSILSWKLSVQQMNIYEKFELALQIPGLLPIEWFKS